jgi:hypothetical protein
LTFRAIEGILLVVRFFAIIYFLTQAYTHSRYQGEKQDLYTFATFLFLGLSLITFFVNRLSQLLQESILAIFEKDQLDKDQINQWLTDNKMTLTVIRAIMRIGMGYLFQNLAFLINIWRWVIILSGGEPTKRGTSYRAEEP